VEKTFVVVRIMPLIRHVRGLRLLPAVIASTGAITLAYPSGSIARAIVHEPRIGGEALRKGIEERADGRNHPAPRGEHSVHNTGSRAQRRQQPNQCSARQVISGEQCGQARYTHSEKSCATHGVEVVGVQTGVVNQNQFGRS